MHSLVPRKLLQKLSFFTAVFEKKNEYPLSSFRIYFLSCPNEELYWLRFLMTEKESLPQHTIRVASCFPVPSFSLTVTTRLFAGHTRCGTQFRELFCLWDASSSSFPLSFFSRLKREFPPSFPSPSRSPSLLALSLSLSFLSKDEFHFSSLGALWKQSPLNEGPKRIGPEDRRQRREERPSFWPLLSPECFVLGLFS